MEKEYIVTREGLQALQAELDDLLVNRRKEVAEKIKEARSFGDLSENSEYDEAKNEQGLVESRIAELEAIMKIVKVVDAEASSDVVGIGCHVTVVDEDGEEDEYKIVSSSESDPALGMISDECPVGIALIGKSSGSVVEVELPGGATEKLTIVSVVRK